MTCYWRLPSDSLEMNPSIFNNIIKQENVLTQRKLCIDVIRLFKRTLSQESNINFDDVLALRSPQKFIFNKDELKQIEMLEIEKERIK